MKSRPEKGNAPVVGATEASSVKNPAITQGFNMSHSTSLTVASTSARPKDAAHLLGVGVSTFWRWSKERQDFPKPRKLSSRCTVFDTQELLAWRDAQAKL